MSHFNEHSLEMAIMELFQQQGYLTEVAINKVTRGYIKMQEG